MRYVILCLALIAVIAACVLGTVILLRDPGSPPPDVLSDAGDALAETVSVAREAKDGLALLAASLSTEPKPRVWTHVDGRTVEAVMTAARKHQVEFKRTSDGRVFTVDLDALSHADRVYVRTWLERNLK